jgi:hypothetical protein
MAKGNGHRLRSPEARTVAKTDEFKDWTRTLDAERRAKVAGAIDHVVAGGPNLGRPRVDRVHHSNLHKLKEAVVDRGIRLLFAFDSHQNAVMLVGGDKTGQWNGWCPKKIELAERLYADHERRIGEESRCLSAHTAGRKSTGMSR